MPVEGQVLTRKDANGSEGDNMQTLALQAMKELERLLESLDEETFYLLYKAVIGKELVKQTQD